jgi:L-alanine-DL-glutamate epimerase-like enolase superfamily enzyme
MNRRDFLSSGATALAATGLATVAGAATPSRPREEVYARLDAAAARPVLDRGLFPDPVIIESIEFLRNGETYLVRVRAKNGAEGIAISNERDIGYLFPVAQRLMIPYLIGKDARDWEALIEGVYLHSSNYKRQGLLFWLPFASLEFAVLDLLGRMAGRSVTTLLGGKPGGLIDIYYAHDDRHRSAEESVERMIRARDRYATRAAKFKVGGRMSRNAEQIAGRSEAIIRLAREKLGSGFTLYADSNGSYDTARGIEIGRRCDEYGIAIYEEPVPHDQYEETKAVADALSVAVAGGEQESSHNRFRWMIAHRAVDIVQPDLFYYGGLVRSIRVARMAHEVGIGCAPHISGTGVGMLYMLHYVSCIPNMTGFQEYKSYDPNLPVDAPPQTLAAKNGQLLCPDLPGLGLTIDSRWLAAATVLPTI